MSRNNGGQLDPSLPLWRFLNLSKFVSMLNSSNLYFCRVDRFDDWREGSTSFPVLERGVSESLTRLEAEEPGKYTRVQALHIALNTESANETFNREGAFAICWHQNPQESGSMWSTYGREGVAIRSTVGRLHAATRNDTWNVRIAPISYIDHDVDEMDPVYGFLYKHFLYSDEREYRAFILNPPPGAPLDDPDPYHPLSIEVPCPLQVLIEAVHVAPGSGDMHRKAVGSLLERYELRDIPVIPSIADTIPEYRVFLENKRQERTAKRRRN